MADYNAIVADDEILNIDGEVQVLSTGTTTMSARPHGATTYQPIATSVVDDISEPMGLQGMDLKFTAVGTLTTITFGKDTTVQGVRVR